MIFNNDWLIFNTVAVKVLPRRHGAQLWYNLFAFRFLLFFSQCNIFKLYIVRSNYRIVRRIAFVFCKFQFVLLLWLGWFKMVFDWCRFATFRCRMVNYLTLLNSLFPGFSLSGFSRWRDLVWLERNRLTALGNCCLRTLNIAATCDILLI